MAKFTQSMRKRLKQQGWKISHDYYDCVIGETTIFSNRNYPGVYAMESGFGRFVIYSDDAYKTEEEIIQEAYKKGYEQGYKVAKSEWFMNII